MLIIFFNNVSMNYKYVLLWIKMSYLGYSIYLGIQFIFNEYI